MLKQRCAWVSADPIYQAYHDQEWGVPIYDDQKLFEFLVLEGQQAGLSWITILHKRENYRQAFYQFDPAKIVAMDATERLLLLENPGIVRNKRKLAAIIQNARAFIRCQESPEGLSELLWSFVGGEPIVNHWQSQQEVPVMTNESKKMARHLKKIGFSFVGPTICYAFMQAVGMVWDHTADCYLKHNKV